LDGDGVLDVVVPGLTSSTTCELKALSGRDGKLLWKRPLAPRENNFYLMTGFPIPVIGDLDGDGKPGVVILDYALRPDVDLNRADTKDCQVLALNGADGIVKWAWQEEMFAGSGRVPLQEQGWFCVNNRPRPRLVRLGAEKKPQLGVCVWAWGCPGTVPIYHNDISSSRWSPETPGKIIILDSQGREFRRFTGDLSGEREMDSQVQRTFGVWSRDLDGQGENELVFLKEGKVTAVSPSTGKKLWEWPLPKQAGVIRSIEPGGKDYPATIVVEVGGIPGELYGLSATTGRPRWRSETLSGSVSPIASFALLPTSDARGMPRVLYTLANQTMVCRQAVPLEPALFASSPEGNPGWGKALRAPRIASVGRTNTSSEDPRRDCRGFPVNRILFPYLNESLALLEEGATSFYWNRQARRLPSPAETAGQIILVFLTLVLPGFVLLRWIRKGSARWRRLFAAAVIVALWLALLSVLLPAVMPGPFVGGIGLVAFLAPLAFWTAAGRWRRVLAMLALYTAIVIGFVLTVHRLNPDYFTGLDWHEGTSWYMILLPAAYLSGVAVLALFSLLIGARAVRRLWLVVRALRADNSKLARSSAG
jgi:hypothetical protein